MSAREEAARLLLCAADQLRPYTDGWAVVQAQEYRAAAAALLAEAGEMEAVVRWLKETPGLRHVLGLRDGDSPESIIATVTRAIERGAHLQEPGDD